MTEPKTAEATPGMAVLRPCPFCGATPDASNPETFATINTSKWGAVQCCITGPEVRTSYMPLEHWRAAAIEAWNTRSAAPEAPPAQTVATCERCHGLTWVTVETSFYPRTKPCPSCQKPAEAEGRIHRMNEHWER